MKRFLPPDSCSRRQPGRHAGRGGRCRSCRSVTVGPIQARAGARRIALPVGEVRRFVRSGLDGEDDDRRHPPTTRSAARDMRRPEHLAPAKRQVVKRRSVPAQPAGAVDVAEIDMAVQDRGRRAPPPSPPNPVPDGPWLSARFLAHVKPEWNSSPCCRRWLASSLQGVVALIGARGTRVDAAPVGKQAAADGALNAETVLENGSVFSSGAQTS